MSEDFDYTQDCLDTARMEKENRKLNLHELRSFCCVRCKNAKCQHAGFGEQFAWEGRIATQEDRLLVNPNFADILDPEWGDLRKFDFEDARRQAMKIEISRQRGDWAVPEVDSTASIVQAAIENHAPEPEPELEPEPPDVIEVASKTQKGTIYRVVMEGGKAMLCDCKAGQYGRRCTHMRWAERDRAMQSREPVPSPPEPTRNDPPPAPRQRRAPVRGEGAKPPRNTPTSPSGILLDEGGPVSRPSPTPARDQWAAKDTGKDRILKPGIKITFGDD